MNAMLQDEKNGYLLAMGELTGTTMFVSAVILGFIVRLGGSSNKENGEGNKINGVPCKGPFLRDIAVLCLVTVVSMSYFHQGVIDYVFVHSMLGIYVVYVLLVLGADAYHIFYHLPSLTKENDGCEQSGDTAKHDDHEQVISVEYGKWKREQPSNGNVNQSATTINTTIVELVDECTPLTHLSSRSDESRSRKHRPKPHSHTFGDTMIEAISNYSCHEQNDHSSDECSEDETKTELAPLQHSNKNNLPTSRLTGWGPKSADGTEAIVTFHPHHAIHPHHDKKVIFRRASSSNSAVVRTSLSHEESWESLDKKPAAVSTQQQNIDENAAVCIDQRSDTETVISRPSSWNEAWHSNAREWNEHWIDFFRDIYHNPENTELEVIVLTVELPFTILRKVRVLSFIFAS